MKTIRTIAAAALLVASGLALHAAQLQQPGIKRTDRREFVRRSFHTPPTRGERNE